MARPAPAAVGDNRRCSAPAPSVRAVATYFLARGFSVTAWGPRHPIPPVASAPSSTRPGPRWSGSGSGPGADPTRGARGGRNRRRRVEGAVFVQENAPGGPRAQTRALRSYRIRRSHADAVGRVELVGAPDQHAAGRLPQRGRASSVGHPFNPPHLVPLVEVVGGSGTDPEAVEWTLAFYNAHGKRAIKVEREVPGPYRQPTAGGALSRSLSPAAFGHGERRRHRRGGHFTALGSAGPSWAPFLTFHLAGGEGGVRARVRAVRAANGELVGRFRHAPPGRRRDRDDEPRCGRNAGRPADPGARDRARCPLARPAGGAGYAVESVRPSVTGARVRRPLAATPRIGHHRGAPARDKEKP